MSKRYQPPEFTTGPRGKIAARIEHTQLLRRSNASGPHADGAPRRRQRGQARRAAIAVSSREN